MECAEPNAGKAAARASRVWDLGVRVFHWLLVVLVATALITGLLAPRPWLDVHVAAGSAIAGLILFRLVWGFFGSTHARFSNFVVSPLTALAHARDLRRGQAHAHVGHNPVGTMMILALLVLLVALTISGAIVLGGMQKEGPLAFAVSFAGGRSTREIHEGLAFTLLAAIVLHLAGVVAESMRTGDNLAAAMISGRKRMAVDAATSPQVRARPQAAMLVLALLGSVLAAGIWQLSQRPGQGKPLAALDATYARECAACHTAHHPSLAPAATWKAIMAGLDDHFGDNAGLDAVSAAALTAYTTANAAETYDTLAANRLRVADPNGSLRITATAGWHRLHRGVDADAFKRKLVGGKVNCGKCHGDAADGRFSPRSISIPKE